jgi:hypothetical protein
MTGEELLKQRREKRLSATNNTAKTGDELLRQRRRERLGLSPTDVSPIKTIDSSNDIDELRKETLPARKQQVIETVKSANPVVPQETKTPWAESTFDKITKAASEIPLVKTIRSAIDSTQKAREMPIAEVAQNDSARRQELFGQPAAYLASNVDKGLLNFNQGLSNATTVAVENTPLKFIPGATDYLKEPQNRFEEYSQEVDKVNQPVSKGQKFLGDVVSAGAQIAPSILLAAINPAIGAAAFGVPAGGQYARQAELGGATPSQQLGVGAAGGAAEAFLQTSLFVKPLLKLISKKVISDVAKLGTTNLIKSFANIGKNVAKTAGGEALEEAAIDPILGLAEKATYNPDKKWIGEGGVIDPKQMGYDALLGAVMGGGIASTSIPFSVADAIEVKKYIEQNYDDTLVMAQGLPEDYVSHKKAVEYAEKAHPINYNDLVKFQQQTVKDLQDYASKQSTESVQPKIEPENIQTPSQVVEPPKAAQKVEALKKIRMSVKQGTPEYEALSDSIERMEKELQDEITTPNPQRSEQIAEELRGLNKDKTQSIPADVTPENVEIPSAAKMDSGASSTVAKATADGKVTMIERNAANVAGTKNIITNPKVKAYQFENPEVKDYYQTYAKYILDDEFVPNEQLGQVTEIMKKLKSDTGLQPSEVKDALERLVKNAGQENVAAAKKVETVIDDMLSNGFDSVHGERVNPIDDYIQIKSKIEGKEIKPGQKATLDDIPTDDTNYAKPVERKTNEADQIGIAGINVRDIKGKDGTIEKMLSPYGTAVKDADGWNVEVNGKASKVATEAEARQMIDSGMERTEAKVKTPVEESGQMEIQGYSPAVQELTGTVDELPKGDDSSTESKTVDDIIEIIEKTIGVPIRTGKFRQKALGIFKVKPEVIRTKVRGDIPVISHELGHYFDKKYKLSDGKQFRGELVTLGRRTSKPSYSLTQIRAEGVAEFVRLYLTNPNRAHSLAPKFLAQFEKTVNADTVKFLAEIRKDISNIINLPQNKKIYNDVSDYETRKSTTQQVGLMQKLYDSWIDDKGPFKRMQKYAEGKGWTGKDIDLLTQNYSGFEAKALYMMFDKQRDLKGDIIGDSFMEILVPISKKEIKKTGEDPLQIRKDFISYLISRRAMDYKDRGLVMPQPFYLYEDNITAMEQKHSEFVGVFDNLRKWEDNNLQLLVDSGIKTKEQIDDIRVANANHVPLYRIREAATAIKAGSGNTLGQSKKVIKKAIGSGASIIDPLESMIVDSFIIRRAAESNDILRELKKMATTVDGIGMMAEKVNIKGEVTKFNVSEVKGQLKKMAELIESQTGDTTFKDALENMDEKYLETMLSIYKPLYKEGDNEITVYDKGKAELYQVDPELYKAIKGLNKEQSHFLLRVLNVPKKILQFGAVTTVNFVARNMIRDTVTSSIQSEANVNPLDIMQGYWSAIKKDKWFKEWIASGGASEYLSVNDRTQAQKVEDDVLGFGISERWQRLAEAFKELKQNNNDRTTDKVKNAAKLLFVTPFDAIRDLVQFSEAGARVAEYRKAVEKGESKETAAAWSRKLSQDFLRHGYYGKELNKVTAFFNANVQGVYRMGESFAKHPVRTTLKGMAYITLPTMLLYFFNHDDEDYQNLQGWRKALFWNIPIGNGKFISIPKPYGYGYIFGTLPETILDKMLHDDPNSWKEIKEGLELNFNVPVMPSAFGPAEEVARNKSWSGTPIEGAYERKNKPAYLIRDDKTSMFANLIGDILKNERGLSPKQIDYLVKGYTGTVGEFFWRLPDAAKKGIESPTDVTKYPLIKAFVTDSAYSTSSINDLYSYGEELSVRLGGLKETGTYKAMAHLPEEKQKELFEMLEAARLDYNQLAESFTDARKAIKEINASKNFTPGQKEQKERQIHIAMNKMAEGFNKAYEKFKQNNDIK